MNMMMMMMMMMMIYFYFNVNFKVFFLINKSAFIGEKTLQLSKCTMQQ